MALLWPDLLPCQDKSRQKFLFFQATVLLPFPFPPSSGKLTAPPHPLLPCLLLCSFLVQVGEICMTPSCLLSHGSLGTQGRAGIQCWQGSSTAALPPRSGSAGASKPPRLCVSCLDTSLEFGWPCFCSRLCCWLASWFWVVAFVHSEVPPCRQH